MPFVPVPKDLTKVKTKVAFNLTRRQLVCFAGAALVGIPCYLFTRGAIGNDIAVLLMIALMLPFFFLAMYERDGQPFEKVVANMLRVKFQCPAVRPYKTENLYAALERQARHDKEVQILAEKAKTAKAAGKPAARGTAAAPRATRNAGHTARR